MTGIAWRIIILNNEADGNGRIKFRKTNNKRERKRREIFKLLFESTKPSN